MTERRVMINVILTLFFLLRPSAAVIHLKGRSFSFTFLDAPARFAVPVDAAGICGSLHLADPIDACFPLHNNTTGEGGGGGGGGGRRRESSRFVLIGRGLCSFEKKVRNAQDADFAAAIIYDDQHKNSLYSSSASTCILDGCCTIRSLPRKLGNLTHAETDRPTGSRDIKDYGRSKQVDK